ncbi:MIND complex subunit NSL1 Ecym_2156 [Eremothecium cymbalariae DBVPG|uniref:Uncharacterized protein n=1 Tax=Eremothecium cymbalariae (strain CBS 270.75 / DBVPG 7215 / KCTC 17166 / NRRL Y-17582) TaxID=931890 RepID=G8JNJ2_ERECY|nr:Hypothetical protein Ecym_2156 [Eremothecium cymbalariae DBVPG\
MSLYPGKLDLSSQEIKHIHLLFKDILDEKLRLHLPQEQLEPSEKKEGEYENDTMERQVLLEIEKFLMSVMDMASDSINVVDSRSGVTLADVINDVQGEYVEPFDIELNEKVRRLYQEWEAETLKVSQLRRNGPKAIVDVYQKDESRALEDIDARIQALRDAREQKRTPAVEEEDADFWNERGEDYYESLKALQLAQELLPRDRMKLEKLKKLVQYVEKDM